MLKLTITGQSADTQYLVAELLSALEDALDDLSLRFTHALEKDDTPENFTETYHTDFGELTLTLEILEQEPTL